MASFPAFLFYVLDQHRFQQLELRDVAKKWKDHDLVFPNLSSGYLHPNHMGEEFRKLLKDAGLPAIHFHDLRHSAATILLAMKVHPKVVQEILGHSQITVTMDLYSHALPSMQDDVTKQWDGEFGKSGRKKSAKKRKKGDEVDNVLAGIEVQNKPKKLHIFCEH
jgi:integrase